MEQGATDVTPKEVIPPALEPLRGRMRDAAQAGFAGAQALVVPLLWSVGTDQEVWSLGPFGESWWVVLATSLAGGYLLMRALIQLVQILRAGARLSLEGYPWRGVLAVALDDRNELELLIEGRRPFTRLSSAQRLFVARQRLLAGVAYVLAMLWTPFAFALLVLTAAHFATPPGVLWVCTLAPTAVLMALSYACRSLPPRIEHNDDASTRATLASWFTAHAPEPVAARRLRLASRTVAVIAVVSMWPIPTLVLGAAFAPVLADIGIPNFQLFLQRTAQLGVLHRYRLEPSADISATDAGHALLAIGFVGHAAAAQAPQRNPLRRYGPWLPESVTADTTTELFRRALAGELTAAELQWMAQTAAHPAHAEVAILSRATAVEHAGTVFDVPLPPDMSLVALPMRPDRPMADVSAARRVLIAVLLDRGDIAGAELAARELLSAGLLLSDTGFVLLDNLVGQVLARRGIRMLEQVYEVTGQHARLATLREDMSLAERTAHVAQLAAGGTRNRLEFMNVQRDVVTDPLALHGLRWEFFLSYNTVSFCLNLNRLVYGAGDDHDQWIEQSRPMLVRTVGEAHLFELGRHGFFGTTQGWPVTWRGRLLSLGLAGSDNIARCMSLLDMRQ